MPPNPTLIGANFASREFPALFEGTKCIRESGTLNFFTVFIKTMKTVHEVVIEAKSHGTVTRRFDLTVFIKCVRSVTVPCDFLPW